VRSVERLPARAASGRWHNALVTQTQSVDQRIAGELGVAVRQVSAAVELLDGGSTVPFIARYRKEVTGALDDAQLRTLEERLRYLRELDERRNAILKEITVPPTPRPGWKTSTCPTSRSGVPRRRSPARPAWSRWPTC
jgi:Tex-like protein N-terminal domain